MQWSKIRSKILALNRFDVQPKLKEAGLPSGLFILPRFALELMFEELSPIAFKVFQILLSRLDYELRTHWVTGISTQRLSELCKCRKAQIYQALGELRQKGYIHVISGSRYQAKARGIRKHIYGQARKLGGNDYNAYSLLPFFVKLYMELDAQRLEEPEDENLDLPPDEEVLKSSNLPELPSTDIDTQGLEEPKNAGSVSNPSEKDQISQRRDTPSLKPLVDKEKENTSVYIDQHTTSFKSLGDNNKSDTSVYIDQPQSNRPSSVYIDQARSYKTTTNEIQTNETHIYDTHTNEGGATAEKKQGSRGNSGPAPADGLGELALNLLTAYLSRNENVKSPIAVLKSLTEAQLETLACDALNWFLTYYVSDWELKDEVNRLVEEHGLKCLELLEYVQLSEEGKVEWLKKKGVLNDGSD